MALRRLFFRAVPLLAALFVVLIAASVAWACPGCKDALVANDPERARYARGFGWSIIFMFSMPYAILGTVSGYFYWLVRRARADKARLNQREVKIEPAAEDSAKARLKTPV